MGTGQPHCVDKPWGGGKRPSVWQVQPRSPKPCEVESARLGEGWGLPAGPCGGPWRQASMWGSGWGRGERRRRGESPGANEASIGVTGGQKDEASAMRAPGLDALSPP